MQKKGKRGQNRSFSLYNFSSKNHRGLSTVIVTLILILVSLVAVGIIWVVVRNIIQTGTEGVGLSQFSLSAKILDVSVDNSSNNISLTVKRNAGEGELEGISFVFSSNADTEVITRNVSLKELEQIKFNFRLVNISVSDLISVSIVPLIKQDEKQISGIALDKYNLGTSKNYFPICTPTNCSILGYVCGTWNNGTCAGNLNCGTCTGGQICNSSGRCVANCIPATCASLGYQCGNGYANGTCSGNLNCGNCSSGFSCNASGRCVASGCVPAFNPCGTAVCGNVANGTCGQISCGICGTGFNCVGGSCVAQPSSSCGNNIIDMGEACDGTNMSGYTCATVAAGLKSGTLSCSSDCKRYVTTSCVAGNTINALSCSQTDVQNAVNSATDGDIVNIPAGNCTWTNTVCIGGSNYCSPLHIVDKSILLKGAGINKTIIFNNLTYSWNNYTIHIKGLAGKPVRISNISIFNDKLNVADILVIDGTSNNWRIDHCSFRVNPVQTGSYRYIFNVYSYGLIDHSYFDNSLVYVNGLDNSSWSKPLGLGTANYVYIEDSVFYYGPEHLYHEDFVDADAGSRIAVRYSRITNAEMHVHGNDGGSERSTHSYEFYENNFYEAGGINNYRAGYLRGGTGVVFNNNIYGNYGDILLIHQKLCKPSWLPLCTVYPCQDQIGRTGDEDHNGVWDLVPLYGWNNTRFGGSSSHVDLKLWGDDYCPYYYGVNILQSDYLKENRDYYDDTVSYNLATGIYNSTYTGDDSSTKQWTYKPYVYPHPLTLI